MTRLALALLCLSLPLLSQQAITVRVNAAQRLARFTSSWAYFGYDEPNYTYAPNGKKLIRELAALSENPIHIRTHNILTTGDGTAALKFGSTNAYTEDASGKPVYDWTIVDKILDTYVSSGATPLVEIGFMPKALSTHPDPYVPVWKPGQKFNQYYVGWSYPPRDYKKWNELVYQFVKHTTEKYGATVVANWQFEVWNEPNISYWHGTPEEYDELYDYTAAAVKRALPSGQVGGPGSTSPRSPQAAAFLRQFLDHCSQGKNQVTGELGAPLDFISYHVKGQPDLVDNHVRMGISKELQDVSQGFEIVRSFPKFQSLPILLTEADPEGCAACSARVYPPNAYRNGTLYPAYTATALKAMLQLQERDHVNLKGVLTWAFEFENQPYFDGFRTLATNGVDKPILNVFRMAGLMGTERVYAESSGSVDVDTLLTSGVRQRPDVDALATRSERKISVLIWNYQDEEASAAATPIDLIVSGLPKDATRVLLRHYRIDDDHSNAYTEWKQIGSPQTPTPEQYRRLEAAGQLQLLNSPSWITTQAGEAQLHFALPIEALSLLELSW